MSLKRSRSHYYGYTNIDFRTKGDKNNLSFYQPWCCPKNFGTMGYSNHTIPDDKKNKVLNVSSNINSLKNLAFGIPNPKTFETCEFYKKNNIKINEKKDIFNERIAQLDESFIGKEVFNGDSMMITDSIKKRKNINNEKKKHSNSTENVLMRNNSLKKDIQVKKDNSVIQEKDNLNKIIESKVNLNKVKKIRNLLRKRYAVRGDYFNIYKIWNESSGKEINLIQAHNIINKLGININYNETKALISSVNERGTDNLNLNEFMKLIFNENSSFNVNLDIFDYHDEKYYQNINDNKSYDKLKLISPNKLTKDEKNESVNYLEEFLRLKIPKLSKIYRDIGVDEKNIDYKTFIKSLKNFTLPEKYCNENIIKGLIEKYPNDKNKENINFTKFSEFCIQKSMGCKIKEDFFKSKDESINLLEKKINQSKSQIYLNKIKLNKYEEKKKDFLSSFNQKEDIINVNKKNNYPKENEINNMQPSLEFINKVYSKNEEYNKINNEIEKSFMIFPSLISDLKPKTRRGANPKIKNTFSLIQPDINSSMYLSEKERFKVKNLNDKIDFLVKERNLKKQKRENHGLNLLKYDNLMDEFSKNLELKNEQKYIIQQANKGKRLYDYELRNKLKNQLME